MEFWIALLVLGFGGGILGIGYLNLVYWLPKKTKNIDTVLSMEAFKASFWLVIFGLVIIILGLLYLIDLIPPSDWWNKILPSNCTK